MAVPPHYPSPRPRVLSLLMLNFARLRVETCGCDCRSHRLSQIVYTSLSCCGFWSSCHFIHHLVRGSFLPPWRPGPIITFCLESVVSFKVCGWLSAEVIPRAERRPVVREKKMVFQDALFRPPLSDALVPRNETLSFTSSKVDESMHVLARGER